MNSLDTTTHSNKQLESEFSTSLSNGLTQEQVLLQRNLYGSNSLSTHSSSWIHLLKRQFLSPLMYLLFGASLLSFFLDSKMNAVIIFIIILLNGFLSFFQEYRAQQALELLKQHLQLIARVVRDGQIVTIQSSDLVPGDIVILNAGEYIPADVRFIEGEPECDESALTGESEPVKKTSAPLEHKAADVYKATNIGFMSTLVSRGNARGLVVTTGPSTLFGAISHLTLETAHSSQFQERITKLSNFILAVIGITLTVLFIFHLLIQGSQVDIIQLLLFSIALTLGLTPEALPTVITFALSRGALKLAEHHVIVKRLSAIEDLGAITILCTDKTGTLTENKLTVVSTFGENKNDILKWAALASNMHEPLDPFDAALWAATPPDMKKELKDFTRLAEIPFDPKRRRNTVYVQQNSSTTLITRGAFETVEDLLEKKVSNDQLRSWINEQSGNRVIAIAIKPSTSGTTEESNMIFVGLIALSDPVKETASKAITKAHKLGITVKMITGDSKDVACSVAEQIGLAPKEGCAISGTEFEALSAEEKQAAAQKYLVFARILPEQKFEIINLLRPNNVVGFLGEGINDAPALKAAHVALAVSTATDSAKDASDIILLRKNLLVIVEGIALGREVFSNTVKYIIASLSSNFGNFYSVAIASLFINFLPLLPIQILLINLLSDLPMIAISTDTVDSNELTHPQQYDLKSIAFLATILGLVSSFFDFVFFSFFIHSAPQILQTNWFIESILTELALIFSVRTKKRFYKARRPSFILMLLSCTAVIATLSLPFSAFGQKYFKFTAPSAQELGIIFLIIVSYFIATEIVKSFYVHLQTNGKKRSLLS